MGITRKQQEWIDAYLREELREDALRDFEAALAGDELFKKEFLFQQSLAKATRLEAVREAMEQAKINNVLKNKKAHPKFEIVQNTIKAATTKNKKRKQRRKIKGWLMIGAVAACVLLTGFWVGWTNHLKKDVEEELLAVFDKTDFIDDIRKDYNILVVKKSRTRSMSKSPNDTIKEAIIKDKLDEIRTVYREKSFDEAFGLINNLEKQFDYQSEELYSYKKEIIGHKLDEIEIARQQKRLYQDKLEIVRQEHRYHERLERQATQKIEGFNNHAIIEHKSYEIEIARLEEYLDEDSKLIIDLERKLDNYKEALIKYKLDEIETAHREKRFDEALKLIENLRKENPSNTIQPALAYYEANLYAERENYTQSIIILKGSTLEKSNIKDDAHWLSGLLYLKTNEKAKAKEEFKILAEASGKYKDKAQQKLDKHFFV